MREKFAGRYSAMSDEQLEYEASQSGGFDIVAREAMRQEFDKRGLVYSDTLSERRDGVSSCDGEQTPPQQTLGHFLEKHPVLSFFGILIVLRMTYKILSASFGG